MTSQVGERAPDFTLRDQHKQLHSLADYRGRNVVLMFFPFAFTGICTGEVCDLRDRRSSFEAAGAAILAVSCDPIGSLRAFADKEGVDYPLLSDFWPHGAVAEKFGVFLPEVGAANRATFVIDGEGVVRWSVATSLGEPRNPDDYADALSQLG